MRDTLFSRLSPKLRVVVVDDSSICRSSLRVILELDDDIEVVGEGEDAFTALPLVEALAPDLVTMDVQMPGKSGIEAVSQIMARRPVPILFVTAQPLTDEAGVAFAAIDSGALDIIPKPAFGDEAAGKALREAVRTLAKIPVFQYLEKQKTSTIPARASLPELIVAIAGPGGSSSVMSLLARIGTVACPVVLHQSSVGDAASYVRQLARIAQRPLTLVTEPKTMFVDGQISLVIARSVTCRRRGELTTEPGEPNATAFFVSVAETYGKAAIGVVLAGRGQDGISGLRALRQADAAVLVESPLSAPVTDLPTAAVDANVATSIGTLQQLADELLVLTSPRPGR